MTTIWMPFYFGDYTKKTSSLTLEQHGAYLMLMKEYWNTGEPLPKDRLKLYRSCGAFSQSEQQSVDYILENYFIEQENNFFHERIDFEINQALDNKRKKSEAGKKGMQQRYNRVTNNDTNSVITELQQSYNPSPSPSPTSKNILLEQWENKNGELNILDFKDWITQKKFDEVKVKKELELFRNQCQAKGYKYSSFKKAFQNWCLNEKFGNGEKKFLAECGGNHY